MRKATLAPQKLREVCVRLTSGHTPLRHDLSVGDVLFLTVECVSPLTIRSDLAKRVLREHLVGELARVAIQEDSVLITIKRRICQATPCYGITVPAVVNQDIAVAQLREGWKPGYVAAYLVSRPGQALADRERTEQMNPYLPVGLLGNLLIPKLSANGQTEIDDLVRAKRQADLDADRLYSEAEKSLSKHLRLDTIPVGYARQYSTTYRSVVRASRVDAQHFRPEFDQLEHLMRSVVGDTSVLPLQQLVTFNQRGKQPVYVEGGPVAVVNSQHIGPQHIRFDELASTSQAVFDDDQRSRLMTNDVVVYSTGAYVGRTSIWLEDMPAVASNHVNILRLKPEYDAAYVALVLNSKVGAMQTEKHGTGSTQVELYPGNLAKFMIPILKPKVQREIGDKVRASYAALKKSKALLEKAKQRVEQLIEQEATA